MNKTRWIVDFSQTEQVRECDEIFIKRLPADTKIFDTKEEALEEVKEIVNRALTHNTNFVQAEKGIEVKPVRYETRFTFVEPSVTPVLESDLQRKVERCYRICYKSEKHMKETPDAFLKNLIYHTTGNHHWSPLEHARIEIEIGFVLAAVLDAWEEKRYTRFLKFSKHPNVVIHNDKRIVVTDPRYVDTYDTCVVTGNFRTFLEFITCVPFDNEGGVIASQYILSKALSEKYPAVFSPDQTIELKKRVDEHEEYIPFKYFDVPCKVRGEAHDYRTYHIVTTRDILQELARHRAMSFSVESTRYCNYGKKGMVFTVPRPYAWADEVLKEFNKPDEDETDYLKSPESMIYFSAIFGSVVNYNFLINNKVKPQVARMVLPGALKTELMMTATIPQWEAFLKLRDDDAAHPQIRILAQMIKQDLNNNIYIHGSN